MKWYHLSLHPQHGGRKTETVSRMSLSRVIFPTIPEGITLGYIFVMTISLMILKHKKMFYLKWCYKYYFYLAEHSYSEASDQGIACLEHSKSSNATDGKLSKLQSRWPNSTAAETTDCRARTETGCHSKQFWGCRARKELFGFGTLRLVEQSGILKQSKPVQNSQFSKFYRLIFHIRPF